MVTGGYLFDAERRDGRIRASHIRERIRTLGPTVRPDLGKQAEGTGGAFAAVRRSLTMYRYDEFDHQFVRERTAQFRDQADRRLKGELTEDEFRPLR